MNEIFFLIFLENRIWHYLQIFLLGDNLHVVSYPISRKNKENIIHLSSAEFIHSMVGVIEYSMYILLKTHDQVAQFTYCLQRLFLLFSHTSRHVIKHTFWHVLQMKTQISLGIHTVWSESSLSAWRNFAPLAIQNTPVKILIRLHKCTGWSESLLGAHVWRYVFWRYCSYRL